MGKGKATDLTLKCGRPPDGEQKDGHELYDSEHIVDNGGIVTEH